METVLVPVDWSGASITSSPELEVFSEDTTAPLINRVNWVGLDWYRSGSSKAIRSDSASLGRSRMNLW